MDVEELMPLLKQMAEGVLKQKIVIEQLQGRIARLEHVIATLPQPAVDAVSNVAIPA